MSHEIPDSTENYEELPVEEESFRMPGELDEKQRRELRELLEDLT